MHHDTTKNENERSRKEKKRIGCMDVNKKNIDDLDIDAETKWKMKKQREEKKYREKKWTEQKIKNEMEEKIKEEENEKNDKDYAEWQVTKDIDEMERDGAFNNPEQYSEDELKKSLLDEYKVFYNDDKGKIKISCPRLAKLLMFGDGRHYIVINDNQDIYVWNDSFYEPIGKGIIENRVSYYLDDFTCKRHKQEVVDFIRNYVYVVRESLNPPIHLINMKNGVYDLEQEKLLANDPNLHFLYELPIVYDAEAKIDKILTFINDLLNKEDIEILQEFLGDCLKRNYNMKKAVMCVGITDTGKSQLLGLIGNFLGEENTANVSLYQLCSDRFATVELYGKHANICADIGATELKFAELFKIVTGGDRLRGQKKHKQSFEFRNFAKLIYSCNKIPDSDDKSDAYYNRWIVIEFSNQFDRETRNPNILVDISTEGEMSGLFNWAVAGLKRLNKNKGYSEHRSLEEVREFMQKGSNPISEFATTYIVKDIESEITKEKLYKAYLEFCKFFDYPTKDSNVFSRQVKQYLPIGFDEGQSRKKKSKRVWRGIRCIFSTSDTQQEEIKCQM